MDFILLCRGRRATQHIALPPPVMGLFGLTLLGLALAMFGLGFAIARSMGYAAPESRLSALQGTLNEQEGSVARAQSDAQHRVDALAKRVGTLNASVLRLNALGSRLVRMAKLDSAEFDFSAPPAIGGPSGVGGMANSVGIPDLMNDLTTLGRTLNQQERELSALTDLMVDRNLADEVRPQGSPVRDGWISSYYGRRADPFTGKITLHQGIDFAAKTGTEVMAVATGVVTWSGERSDYGRMVEINHGNGYVTRYAHNAQNLVEVGDRVRKGQRVALMGSSGHATGPHVHFEIWYQGQLVDPQRYVQQVN